MGHGPQAGTPNNIGLHKAAMTVQGAPCRLSSLIARPAVKRGQLTRTQRIPATQARGTYGRWAAGVGWGGVGWDGVGWGGMQILFQ